jgi:hypothetical protein
MAAEYRWMTLAELVEGLIDLKIARTLVQYDLDTGRRVGSAPHEELRRLDEGLEKLRRCLPNVSITIRLDT